MTREAAVRWMGTSRRMNKTRGEALARALVEAEAGRDPRVQWFLVPPLTALAKVCRVLAGTSVRVGAQNGHWGAWTGEVSRPQIADCGATLLELGHSERREHFGEADETVGLKVAVALGHGLTPHVCVGERASDKEAGRTDEVLERQVRAALAPVAGAEALVPLACEPVCPSGDGGVAAEPACADVRHARIAQVARRAMRRPAPMIYWGSVNPGTCEALIGCPHVDGFLVGRSAWDSAGHLDILARVSRALTAETTP